MKGGKCKGRDPLTWVCSWDRRERLGSSYSSHRLEFSLDSLHTQLSESWDGDRRAYQELSRLHKHALRCVKAIPPTKTHIKVCQELTRLHIYKYYTNIKVCQEPAHTNTYWGVSRARLQKHILRCVQSPPTQTHIKACHELARLHLNVHSKRIHIVHCD